MLVVIQISLCFDACIYFESQFVVWLWQTVRHPEQPHSQADTLQVIQAVRMAMTFKVVETFHLPEGSGPQDLAEAIQIVADCPFRLEWLSQETSVRVVRLTRQASFASGHEDQQPAELLAEEELRPEPPRYPPPGREDPESSSWWQSSSSSWWSADDRASADSQSWQKRQTPCHVCGKVRSQHPDKKFCDRRAVKKARQDNQ